MNRPETGPNTFTEELNVRGGQVVEKVRELIAAGNVRHVVVKHGSRVVVEFPLTVGVIGTLLAPQLAILGTLAALLTDSVIEVTRQESSTGSSPVAR